MLVRSLGFKMFKWVIILYRWLGNLVIFFVVVFGYVEGIGIGGLVGLDFVIY